MVTNTIASAMKRFKADVLDHKPSKVFIMFGIKYALIRTDTKQPQVRKSNSKKYHSYDCKIAKTQGIQLIDNHANAIHKTGNTSDSMLTKSELIDPLLGFIGRQDDN